VAVKKNILLFILAFGVFNKGVCSDIIADEVDYYQLAEKYSIGKEVERDFNKAVEYYMKAYENGNEESVIKLCGLYGFGAMDESMAAEMCQIAAKKDPIVSQYNLGFLYFAGIGVKRDVKKAMELFQYPAEQGHTSAEFGLGVIYLFEPEGEQNCHEALHWLKLAADNHYYEALYVLGMVYFQGKCVKQDHHKAFEFFTKAANPFYEKRPNKLVDFYDDKGETKSQNILAGMYYYGYGTDVNLDRAFYWFSKAAEQNYPEAIRNLAEFYANGVIVERDLKKADELYKKADEIERKEAETKRVQR
jgi:TPR repeat protein